MSNSNIIYVVLFEPALQQHAVVAIALKFRWASALHMTCCCCRQVSAEREAWKMAEEHGLDLVTVLPNFNLGPALSRQETKGLSVGFMKVTGLPCKLFLC